MDGVTDQSAPGCIAVSGATGFIGRALAARLLATSHGVVALTRQPANLPGAEVYPLGDLERADGLEDALHGVDSVVHLAARAHVLKEAPGADVGTLYRAANVDATCRLARAAVACGVRRFVFVSSIKVLGERTLHAPFTAASPVNPADAYAQSKWEAEQALQQVAAETGLDVIVVRPPLVYGPGVGANFQRLMALVRRGLPLPLGAIRNQRSMVALDNLVDLLLRCLKAPTVINEPVLVSDGYDLSTPALVRLIAAAMGRPARLLPVPETALRLAGRLTGRSAEIDRLCSSLRVDTRRTRELLEWCAPLSVEEGVRRAVADYMKMDAGTDR